MKEGQHTPSVNEPTFLAPHDRQSRFVSEPVPTLLTTTRGIRNRSGTMRIWNRIGGSLCAALALSMATQADELTDDTAASATKEAAQEETNTVSADTETGHTEATEHAEDVDPYADVDWDNLDGGNESAESSDADSDDPFADVDWDDLDAGGDDEDGGDDWDFSDLEFEETPTYSNWLTVAFQNTWVDGDNAAFQRRFRQPKGPAGGIESLHYESDINTRSRIAMDSRIMPGIEDYYFQLFFEDPDVGWFRTGFKQWRNWYDGSGGYYPTSQTWISPFNDELALDSGEIWFEGGLTLPEKPIFTFGYRHRYRNGEKDSLVWGDSALIAGSALGGVRGIVPSFRDIHEESHSFRLGAEHTIGNSQLKVGMRFDVSQNEQSLKTHRHPGGGTFDRKVTTTDRVDTDLFNIHASSVTRFSEKLQMGAGYAFTTLDNDVSGSRIFGNQYEALFDPVFSRRHYRDMGYLGLNGGSQLHQSTLNLNLFYRPWENVAFIPALRAERTSTESSNGFAATMVDPTLTTRQDNYWLDSERQYQELNERLELRYTGFADWSLYTRGEWTQGGGDLDEFLTGINPLARMTDDDRRVQKYTAGAHWYPLSNLNFGFQYYHKINDLAYDHDVDSTGNQFPSSNQLPAFIRDRDFQTDDVNVRMTWRPISNVTLVSRYDYQVSEVASAGERIGSAQQANLEAHILSESITWQPWSRVYLQGGFSYTYDTTETSAGSILVAGQNLTPNFDNHYWNVNGTIGWAATDKVDLDLSYYYYCADNYLNNSAGSMPYGTDFNEHIVRFGVQYRVKPELLWKSSYSYFQSEDDTSGGNNNYKAHGIYTSIQYMF